MAKKSNNQDWLTKVLKPKTKKDKKKVKRISKVKKADNIYQPTKKSSESQNKNKGKNKAKSGSKKEEVLDTQSARGYWKTARDNPINSLTFGKDFKEETADIRRGTVSLSIPEYKRLKSKYGEEAVAFVMSDRDFKADESLKIWFDSNPEELVRTNPINQRISDEVASPSSYSEVIDIARDWIEDHDSVNNAEDVAEGIKALVANTQIPSKFTGERLKTERSEAARSKYEEATSFIDPETGERKSRIGENNVLLDKEGNAYEFNKPVMSEDSKALTKARAANQAAADALGIKPEDRSNENRMAKATKRLQDYMDYNPSNTTKRKTYKQRGSALLSSMGIA